MWSVRLPFLILAATALIGAVVVGGVSPTPNAGDEWIPAGRVSGLSPAGEPAIGAPWPTSEGFVVAAEAQERAEEEERDLPHVLGRRGHAAELSRIVIAADRSARFEGRGTPGAELKVVIDDEVAARVVVAGDGTWKAESPKLLPGDHRIEVAEAGAAAFPALDLRIAVPPVSTGEDIVAFESPAARRERVEVRMRAERLADAASREFDRFTRDQGEDASGSEDEQQQVERGERDDAASGAADRSGADRSGAANGIDVASPLAPLQDWYSRTTGDYHRHVIPELARRGIEGSQAPVAAVPPPERPGAGGAESAIPTVGGVVAQAADWLRSANRTYQDAIVRDLAEHSAAGGRDKQIADAREPAQPTGTERAPQPAETVADERGSPRAATLSQTSPVVAPATEDAEGERRLAELLERRSKERIEAERAMAEKRKRIAEKAVRQRRQAEEQARREALTRETDERLRREAIAAAERQREEALQRRREGQRLAAGQAGGEQEKGAQSSSVPVPERTDRPADGRMAAKFARAATVAELSDAAMRLVDRSRLPPFPERGPDRLRPRSATASLRTGAEDRAAQVAKVHDVARQPRSAAIILPERPGPERFGIPELPVRSASALERAAERARLTASLIDAKARRANEVVAFLEAARRAVRPATVVRRLPIKAAPPLPERPIWNFVPGSPRDWPVPLPDRKAIKRAEATAGAKVASVALGAPAPERFARSADGPLPGT